MSPHCSFRTQFPFHIARLALGSGLVAACALGGCATGVDVSDEELAEYSRRSSAVNGSQGPIIGTGSNTGGTNGGSGSSTAGTASTNTSGSGGFGTAGNVGSGGTNGTPPVSGPPLSGGTCGAAVSPTALGGCETGGSVQVLYTDRSDGPNFNQITMTLGLANSGASFNLSDLVLRYWFNADGQGDFTADIDYASVGNGNVCVQFGDQLGSAFADIGFTSADQVTEGIEQVQVRIHTPNYTGLDQANDFSFMGGANQTSNQNVTAYIGGTRVAGCEP